jgi:hypothetical protein
MWHRINEVRDDKSFMGVESFMGIKFFYTVPKYGCVEN